MQAEINMAASKHAKELIINDVGKELDAVNA